jgi:hypothetical protein
MRPEKLRLHGHVSAFQSMQAAALDASKDAQLKDKRIQHLERKVIDTTYVCKTWMLERPGFAYIGGINYLSLQVLDPFVFQLGIFRSIKSRDERAAKAREFSEAQQHIGRLMGVMGFSANAPEYLMLERPGFAYTGGINYLSLQVLDPFVFQLGIFRSYGRDGLLCQCPRIKRRSKTPASQVLCQRHPSCKEILT